MKQLSNPKQQWERLPVSVDFSLNMNDGETINATESEVIVVDTLTRQDVSSTMIMTDSVSVIDGTKLQAVIKAGESKHAYKASFRAYISDSKRLEQDIYFEVEGD